MLFKILNSIFIRGMSISWKGVSGVVKNNYVIGISVGKE